MRKENEALGLTPDSVEDEGEDMQDLLSPENDDDSASSISQPTGEPRAAAAPAPEERVIEQNQPGEGNGPPEVKGSTKRRKKKNKSRVASGMVSGEASPSILASSELLEDKNVTQAELISRLDGVTVADGGEWHCNYRGRAKHPAIHRRSNATNTGGA